MAFEEANDPITSEQRIFSKKNITHTHTHKTTTVILAAHACQSKLFLLNQELGSDISIPLYCLDLTWPLKLSLAQWVNICPVSSIHVAVLGPT